LSYWLPPGNQPLDFQASIHRQDHCYYYYYRWRLCCFLRLELAALHPLTLPCLDALCLAAKGQI